jgi:hypothetical protein
MELLSIEQERILKHMPHTYQAEERALECTYEQNRNYFNFSIASLKILSLTCLICAKNGLLH